LSATALTVFACPSATAAWPTTVPFFSATSWRQRANASLKRRAVMPNELSGPDGARAPITTAITSISPRFAEAVMQ